MNSLSVEKYVSINNEVESLDNLITIMPKFNIITEALPLCIILWYKPVEQASIETLHIIASYFTSLVLDLEVNSLTTQFMPD